MVDFELKLGAPAREKMDGLDFAVESTEKLSDQDTNLALNVCRLNEVFGIKMFKVQIVLRPFTVSAAIDYSCC